MRSVCAVSYLLVLSEGLEARRLHMVSPAAEPVVAFYTNNTNNKRFWSSTLHSLSKNKPKSLLNFICTIRHSNIDTCKHCEPQWFNPQRDFTGLMFSSWDNPDSMLPSSNSERVYTFKKSIKMYRFEHELNICWKVFACHWILFLLTFYTASKLFWNRSCIIFINPVCDWTVYEASLTDTHVWWLTLGDFEVWPGDGVFHNIWRDGAHLPF